MELRGDLLVFSHLRWDFVWQRPQHLITRLAKDRRVFFIEEPIHSGSNLAWEKREAGSNLIVCRPHTPSDAPGFHDEQLGHLYELVQQLVEENSIENYLAWFYTPMAFPLLESLRPSLVIYDCMDELSAFRNAPQQMLTRESQLLQAADVVFTGGPSLYRGKKDRHPNVYCFPSSVDTAHFGQARGNLKDHPAQQHLPRPRLGFFGVIDERLDVALIDEVAQSRPDWQISLVGPVVKIDEASLPRHPNLHYFGQQAYEQLPAFLAGWDVCLLPFALNESTRFISPTKTLEYMAAERPIVSTPIADVAGPYSDIVYLANSPSEFIAACERALKADPTERSNRTEAMRSVLAKTSWDRTASEMNDIMDELVRKKTSTTSAAPSQTSSEQTPPVVIVGAGPTGLSAAYHLGDQALLLEQNDTIGGWCRSVEMNGFTFDFAGHIMFSNDPYVHEMYQMLLGENVHWQDREAWIFSKDVFTRYPFQGALYGLPADVIKECIIGAIESRFGPLKKSNSNASLAQNLAPASTSGAAHQNGGSNGNGNANANGNGSANGNGNAERTANANGNGNANGKRAAIKDCCADGILESSARLALPTAAQKGSQNGSAPEEPKNFEEFIYKVWGAGIAKHFAIPYNQKLWAVPLSEMETSWLGGRVPLPDLEEMLEGALRPVPKPMGPNARFGYPLRGGFQALMNGFLPHLESSLRLNSRVSKICLKQRTLHLQDGTEIPFQQLISTMPLPVLIRLMGDAVPAEVQRAAAALRYISVRCVHLGVGRPNLTEKHWIYYPEDTVFHRIFVQGNASPHCNPPGGFGLTCEITYHKQYKPLPFDGDELIQRCIEDCHQVGLFEPSDPVWAAMQVDLPHAYVVYDHARPKNVALIRQWLLEQGILLAGRYSEWEYYNSDHAFLAGKKAAENVLQLRKASDQLTFA